MKRFVLILLVICPWLINAQQLHYATSYDSAFIQAKEEGIMVLVYAYSPCRLCDDMTEKVLSLPDIAGFLNDHFILVDMDMPWNVNLLSYLYAIMGTGLVSLSVNRMRSGRVKTICIVDALKGVE